MPIDEADVHKHLDFLQLTITRMAANSFLIKGWAATLVVGLIAFTSNRESSTAGALIGLLPAILFWGLDAYYLHQERLFRKLYDIVRKRDKTDFSLNTSDMPKAQRKEAKSWFEALFAIVIWPFYLSLILVVFFVWQFASPPPTANPPMSLILGPPDIHPQPEFIQKN